MEEYFSVEHSRFPNQILRGHSNAENGYNAAVLLSGSFHVSPPIQYYSKLSAVVGETTRPSLYI